MCVCVCVCVCVCTTSTYSVCVFGGDFHWHSTVNRDVECSRMLCICSPCSPGTHSISLDTHTHTHTALVWTHTHISPHWSGHTGCYPVYHAKFRPSPNTRPTRANRVILGSETDSNSPPPGPVTETRYPPSRIHDAPPTALLRWSVIRRLVRLDGKVSRSLLWCLKVNGVTDWSVGVCRRAGARFPGGTTRTRVSVRGGGVDARDGSRLA